VTVIKVKNNISHNTTINKPLNRICNVNLQQARKCDVITDLYFSIIDYMYLSTSSYES